MRHLLEQHEERGPGSSKEGGSSFAGTQSAGRRDWHSLPFADLLQQCDSILSSFARHQQPLQQICEETLRDDPLLCVLRKSNPQPSRDEIRKKRSASSKDLSRPSADLVCQLVDGAQCHEPLLLPLVDGFLSAHPVGSLRRHRRSYQVICHLLIFLLPEVGNELFKGFVFAYANPVTMQLLLEFVFDEEALRQRVLPRWLQLYEQEYIENHVLPQLRKRALQVEVLLLHLRKEADCCLLSAASKALPAASAAKSGTGGVKKSGETAANKGVPQFAARKSDEGDRAPEPKPPQRRHTAAVSSPARETARAGASSLLQFGRRRSTAAAAACRPARAPAPVGSAGAAEPQPEAWNRGPLDPSLEETASPAKTVSRMMVFASAAETETASATNSQNGAASLPAVAPAAAAAAAATAPAVSANNVMEPLLTRRETRRACLSPQLSPLALASAAAVPLPFELLTDKRPTKLAALQQAAEDAFLSIHTFCPRLRSRPSLLYFSKRPSRPVRHTVASLLRAERLLLLQVERGRDGKRERGGDKERESETRRETHTNASLARLPCAASFFPLFRTRALRAVAEQRSRGAAAARSQRLKEAQWLAAGRSNEKQRLMLQQERQGTTSREARRRVNLALQQLLLSKRLKAERLKREREGIRREASRASQEIHLKRRVAASRLRGLVTASSVVARMRRAAAVSVSKDATCSGPLQQLSLDSKCLLEVRLRAELLKRKAAEILQCKRDSLLRAKAARAEALAEKAARVSNLLTTKQMEAEAQRQKRETKLSKLKETTIQRADAAALRAAALLLEKKQRQWESRAALKQEELKRQISQEYLQSTRQATQQTVRQQLMRGLERAALSRHLMRVAQQVRLEQGTGPSARLSTVSFAADVASMHRCMLLPPLLPLLTSSRAPEEMQLAIAGLAYTLWRPVHALACFCRRTASLSAVRRRPKTPF
ncbi:hypothetical protein Esti_005341 [Eimeria stiedai]